MVFEKDKTLTLNHNQLLMTTILAQTFTNIKEAFEYFVEEVYPQLKNMNISEEDKREAETAKRDFLYSRGISEQRMLKVLKKYADVDLKISFK